MTTTPITKTKTKFQAPEPEPWEECGDCYDVPPAPRSFAHIVIFTEDGKLIASPECGQNRLGFRMAGHLALAGVQIHPSEVLGGRQILDAEQLDRTVAALNAAGAGVTVLQP